MKAAIITRKMCKKGGDSPDNLHGVIVLLVVDAHDEHGSVGTGSGDQHPLSTASQVSLRNTKEVRGQRENDKCYNIYFI